MVKKSKDLKLTQARHIEKLRLKQYEFKNKRKYIDLFKQDNKNTLV